MKEEQIKALENLKEATLELMGAVDEYQSSVKEVAAKFEYAPGEGDVKDELRNHRLSMSMGFTTRDVGSIHEQMQNIYARTRGMLTDTD